MRVLLFEDLDIRITWFQRELIGHDLHIFKKANDAIEALSLRDYDLIFLDHDVEMKHYGEPERFFSDSGSGIAEFLFRNEEYISPNARIIIHSCNPHGSARMLNYLRSRRAKHIPFPDLKEKGLDWLLDG